MITDRSYRRPLQPPEQSFFLFGMRGVGKSTWSRQVFPDAHRFDLLDEGLFQSYLRDARLFGRELLRIQPGKTIVLDEVQRLPALLNEVHRFIESHGRRFVLLGSSAPSAPRRGSTCCRSASSWRRWKGRRFERAEMGAREGSGAMS